MLTRSIFGGNVSIFNDSCTTNTMLKEYFCPSISTPCNFTLYNCPNGCLKGACINVTITCSSNSKCGNVSKVSQCSVNITKNISLTTTTTPTCINPGTNLSSCKNYTDISSVTCPGGCSKGVCLPICIPNCTGKQCGSNGCGGTCGSCDIYHFCSSGICTADTTPPSLDVYLNRINDGLYLMQINAVDSDSFVQYIGIWVKTPLMQVLHGWHDMYFSCNNKTSCYKVFNVTPEDGFGNYSFMISAYNRDLSVNTKYVSIIFRNTSSIKNPVCFDSDGGKNYSIKGIINDSGILTEDSCIFNSSQLIEYYCQNNNLGNAEIVNCQNGCMNGTCIPVLNIVCSTNSQCGSPIQHNYCYGNTSITNLTTPTCIYPGTSSSLCRNVESILNSSFCNNGCYNGNCITALASSRSGGFWQAIIDFFKNIF